MPNIRVLFDGWPLLHQPNHPQSIHLRTLLELAPEGTQSILALPANKPQLSKALANQTEILTFEQQDSVAWKQKDLAKLAEEHGAQIIHSTSSSAPLFGRVPAVISPANYPSQQSDQGGFRQRLGQSLDRGGVTRAHTLHPSDIPAIKSPGTQHSISPIAHPAFIKTDEDLDEALNMPESYILYHGPGDPKTLNNLFESWTWAASSIGEYFPLLLLGLNDEEKEFAESRLLEYHLSDFVQVLPQQSFTNVVRLYQHCSALTHPAHSPVWAGSIRHALSCAKAVVAFDDPANQALVGSAAFLVSENDLRAFGAALISVVVDETVTFQLEEAAEKRAQYWKEKEFSTELREIYEKII
jgi:glycosyltransferase involved in cell wall biosynthesis